MKMMKVILQLFGEYFVEREDRSKVSSTAWIYAMKLDSSAKIIDIGDLFKLRKQHKKNKTFIEGIDKDINLFALRLNYDGLTDHRNEGEGVIIVLNNNKVIVDKRTLPGGEFAINKLIKQLKKNEDYFSNEYIGQRFTEQYVKGKGIKEKPRHTSIWTDTRRTQSQR